MAALGAAVVHLPQDAMLHVLRAFVLERHEGAPEAQGSESLPTPSSRGSSVELSGMGCRSSI